MVHISVPLKGAKVGSVDIVSTDEYLKVKLTRKYYPLFKLHSTVGHVVAFRLTVDKAQRVFQSSSGQAGVAFQNKRLWKTHMF